MISKYQLREIRRRAQEAGNRGDHATASRLMAAIGLVYVHEVQVWEPVK